MRVVSELEPAASAASVVRSRARQWIVNGCTKYPGTAGGSRGALAGRAGRWELLPFFKPRGPLEPVIRIREGLRRRPAAISWLVGTTDLAPRPVPIALGKPKP